MKKRDIRKIHQLILGNEKYPFQTRIAAMFIRAGGTEEEWIKLSQTMEFKSLPSPVLVGIHNRIRDIKIGLVKLTDIPCELL